jgi:hypothetical protein
MKEFLFTWRVEGSVMTARERFASIKDAERRANELAREFGAVVRVFWKGWRAKAQP